MPDQFFPINACGVDRTLIGVMNDPFGRSALLQRHLQCAQDEFLVRTRAHSPADDPARIQVEQDRQVKESLSCPNEGTVAHPDAVGRLGLKLALHEIGRRREGMVVLYRDAEAPLASGFNARVLPEPGDPVLAARDAVRP